MNFIIDRNRLHLGGDVQGGDPRSWVPEVWALLAPPGSKVLDVGCGEGHAMRWFEDNGYTAQGVDGLEREDVRIYPHDFTTGPFLCGKYDLIWSCEFLEHVEEQFVPNFMATFKQGKRVAVTAAPPGQGGYHHVNCQLPSYWYKVFEQYGFTYNAQLTKLTKRAADHKSWWAKNGMVFDGS